MITMTMRIQKALKVKAGKAAKAKGFTLSAWVRQLIKEGMDKKC
jgi:predicted HicB family RNase H-like nuclease